MSTPQQPFTATFAVHFPRAGRTRDVAFDVVIEIDPSAGDPDDVMPALHEAIGARLIEHVPGMRGQDLALVQERVDPPSGFMRINDGFYGGGTWKQTSTTPSTNKEQS